MGASTEISWTDSTFNAWWGCQRVSPGCEHCYAEAWAKRTGASLWGPGAERRLFGDKHWAEPLKWNAAAAKAGVRHRVFCSSMADVFEDRRDLDAQRERLWKLIEATPMLDWQLLTKRPENMILLAPARWIDGWPLNAWAGATCEDQERADKRVPFLLSVPAVVRFLSCEPLLGPVDLTLIPANTTLLNGGNNGHGFDMLNALTGFGHFDQENDDEAREELEPEDSRRGAYNRISWCIVGGESGPGARLFDLAWARKIVADCKTAGVPVWVKQLGARPWAFDYARTGCLRLSNKKGADMAEWPEDLRVREMPASPAGASS